MFLEKIYINLNLLWENKRRDQQILLMTGAPLKYYSEINFCLLILK